ncbi:MAG: hypothetical protein HC831_11765 [Chloroflexia bacterium]|nr:hypothetical protein [Chloroflexia bacterium]
MNIIIINLDRASERKPAMEDQLKKAKLDAYFYKAVDGEHFINPTFIPKINLEGGWRNNDLFKPGEIGCTLSHIGALSMAKALDWPYVIILEDDITIATDFTKRVNKLLKMVPKNWEHIYLSGTPHNTSINPSFMQLIPSGRTDCTHSYMINKSAYDKVIKKLLSMKTTTDDLYNHMILTERNLISFSFFPYVTHSNSSYSYIWNKAAGHNIKNESKNYYAEFI